MNDLWDKVIYPSLIAASVIIITVDLLEISVCTYNYYIASPQIVDVYVDSKVVYTGKKACVFIRSDDLSLLKKVSINDGFLCMRGKAFYMTKDVEILPSKEIGDEV